MVYEEPSQEELEDIGRDDDLKPLDHISIDDVAAGYDESDDYDTVHIEHPEPKGKGRNVDHESKARRELEEYFQRKLLRKELDYLYDDDFLEESNEDKRK